MRKGTAHRLDKYAIEDILRKAGYKCRHSFASDIKIYAFLAIALHRLAYLSGSTVEEYHNCIETALFGALRGHGIRDDLLKRLTQGAPIIRCKHCGAEFPEQAEVFQPPAVEQGKYPYHVNRPSRKPAGTSRGGKNLDTKEYK